MLFAPLFFASNATQGKHNSGVQVLAMPVRQTGALMTARGRSKPNHSSRIAAD
jgi:hypothetical protein